MKKLLFLPILYLVISCQKNIDDKNFHLFQESDNKSQFLLNHFDTWTPQETEIEITLKLINEITENNKIALKPSFTEVEHKYYFQLIPYIDENKTKLIFVNALCKTFVNEVIVKINKDSETEVPWYKEYYSIYDGGSCFWNVKINPTGKKYTDFNINGL